VAARSSNFFDIKAPIAIAHRGGGAVSGKDKYKHENTLEAFKASVALGYRFLEMDTILTADNQLVVIHVAKDLLESLARKKGCSEL